MRKAQHDVSGTSVAGRMPRAKEGQCPLEAGQGK